MQLVHVGALEVQNVKKAINRYGTLPKGARIGAYLESLRQSGIPSNQEPAVAGTAPVSPVIPTIDQEAIVPPVAIPEPTTPIQALSPRQTNLRNTQQPPQMTRSNSSSGVVSTYQPPSSPRNRMVATTTRQKSNDNIGLRTFRAANTSTFRTASPSRSVQPTLADLEFPPPPDLPPPPANETFNSCDQCDLPPPCDGLVTTASAKCGGGSPVTVKKEWKSKSDEPRDSSSSDVRNVEPSVKEASSRFGVNLRRRDTVETMKADAKVPQKKDSRTDDDLSPDEVPLPPPPPPPMIIETTDSFNSKPGMKEMLELKLINEIKQGADVNKQQMASTKKSGNSVNLDPASQLVSELCANFSMDKVVQNEYAIAVLKTNDNFDKESPQQQLDRSQKPLASPITDSGLTSNVSFKLKKVEKKGGTASTQKEDSPDAQIIDFKARLRKIDTTAEKQPMEEKSRKSEELTTTTDFLETGEEQDDKRRSTGSISSLKKLWETKEANSVEPLSPKLSARGIKQQENTPDPAEDSPEDHSGTSTRSSTSKGGDQGGKWPPETEKPLVPAKPPKTLLPSGKHFGGSIYATPNCNNRNSTGGQEEESSKHSETKGTKQGVIDISNVIENSIVNLKSSNTIVMASWLQLSDKVGLLHGMCSNLTDSVIMPQARFQFRDLLARLESQARQLRAAGTRNITENTKLLSDIQNTIKDVINMVQR